MNSLKTKERTPNYVGTPSGIVSNESHHNNRAEPAVTIKKLAERKEEPPPALANPAPAKKEPTDGLWEIDYGHNW